MKRQPKASAIRLCGVRQNNLKGFDLDIPLGKLTAITGLSGTGKSSLAFETLHAEGQRRYVETFSPYARQFLELLPRPQVEHIDNIHPSIAIQQKNNVKTSRSTVGTITELCDYCKVWFAQQSQLHDPASGEVLSDDNPQSIWKKSLQQFRGQEVLIAFTIPKPATLSWDSLLPQIQQQGFARAIMPRVGQVCKIPTIDPKTLAVAELTIVQDRAKIIPTNRARFIEAATAALKFGHGAMALYTVAGKRLCRFSAGLRSPHSGKSYRSATPSLFSFNSPVGACPKCRGFGRTIEIDPQRVIPDPTRSLQDGAIKPFQGKVYGNCLKDLARAAKKRRIPFDKPWQALTASDRAFIWDGEPDFIPEENNWQEAWYGIHRFFQWLEENTYKMHVRVFLAKYRTYTRCTDCQGTRLQPEAHLWQWRGYTLPELYALPISELYSKLKSNREAAQNPQADLAAAGILARLHFLEAVGLGYLTLDRSSRTLSGGETQRVNLTTCLGTALVDTLFVLDEPSIGLHACDIDRLIGIMRRLTDLGNTVVVVEHDEAVIRAADHLIELGPVPGRQGGQLCFTGTPKQILKAKDSITGAYLSGKKTLSVRHSEYCKGNPLWLKFHQASKHNLQGINVELPVNRFTCLTGISGSGKSTLLNNVIYQGLLQQRGTATEDVATIKSLFLPAPAILPVLVDQSPISKTPRSNIALFSKAWTPIRKHLAQTSDAQQRHLTESAFSFNSPVGRCEHCHGLGYEQVDMQFLSEVTIPCPLCQGNRFKPEVLQVTDHGKNPAQILALTVTEALAFFSGRTSITKPLQLLADVGLGYLPLGQPLNLLSGGEAQRLKLASYLKDVATGAQHYLLLLDEPTTGLHRDDINRLLVVLRRFVEAGHTLVVIEHQLDVIQAADWVIELGPGAGAAGGKVVATGPPALIATGDTHTAPFLASALGIKNKRLPTQNPATATQRRKTKRPGNLEIVGAREHNLQNIHVSIPHNKLTVVTGVSGSGKSSLAFDIVFAEGQRRFMDAMSAYARQFVEQLQRPDVDHVTGIPPTVAIEQHTTHGTRKSTVATITEVAQYLRLLYAKLGTQYNPTTGLPVTSASMSALKKRLTTFINRLPKAQKRQLYLGAPMIRARKGHHQPFADWAAKHDIPLLRIDGAVQPTTSFQPLDRYREHDIDVLSDNIAPPVTASLRNVALEQALQLGKGTCFLTNAVGESLLWLSTKRTDPTTGEAFPELEPKHFSWNSPRGWCPTCHGYGCIYAWMAKDEQFAHIHTTAPDDTLCPDCRGERLNPASRHVRLHCRGGQSFTLPQLLQLPPKALLSQLKTLKLDIRGKLIAQDILPQISERIQFLDRVGLGYLTLDRPTNTLSGGEAQRIRLAAQLGSNLTGALFVLDEPTIGLHARDNANLLQTLFQLRDKGNTLLIVEHDEDTIRQADHVIDLGPGAGLHGGHVLATGTPKQIARTATSITGQCLRKNKTTWQQPRPLPRPWALRQKSPPCWLVAQGAHLRNLKGDDLQIPLHRLTVVCGVSGAGKSTLIRHLLKPAVAHAIQAKQPKLTRKDLARAKIFHGPASAPLKALHNGHLFKQVIEVDQAPIGKTPRSTPATYIGAFDSIRHFFATLPDAQIHGYTASTFSFNTAGGRCESCRGAGRAKLEMSFLPDTYVTCDDCHGARYGQELRNLCWRGKNITDVLQMSFEEAAEFFAFHQGLHHKLQLMVDTGLGYLTLGQASPTLSGGEAQRLKLVNELAKGLPTWQDRTHGRSQHNLYILEEPTIGLHTSDCYRLIEVLQNLVSQGHTVIVIEHHLDLIAAADYLVEVGPEGGDAGGQIIHQGPPQGLGSNSPTAPYLKKHCEALS